MAIFYFADPDNDGADLDLGQLFCRPVLELAQTGADLAAAPSAQLLKRLGL